MSSKFSFWPLKKVSKSKKTSENPAAEKKIQAEPSIAEQRPFRSVGSATQIGFAAFNRDKANQDRHICLVDFGGSPHHAIFAVFDGHGASGDHVSEFIARVLPLNLIGLVSDCDVHECLRSGFAQTAAALESNNKINSMYSGTTAVLTYVTKEFIITANAGDSRAVLGRTEADGSTTAIALSKDQKPEREDEKARILRNCGRVQPCRGSLGEPIGPLRIWLPNQDVPGLAMTRSFGDTVAKSIGLNAEPEVEKIARHKSDRYLIVASDGVWEFISNEEAVDIVSKCASAPEACLALQRESIKRWKAEEDVIDDITSIVVFL